MCTILECGVDFPHDPMRYVITVLPTIFSCFCHYSNRVWSRRDSDCRHGTTVVIERVQRTNLHHSVLACSGIDYGGGVGGCQFSDSDQVRAYLPILLVRSERFPGQEYVCRVDSISSDIRGRSSRSCNGKTRPNLCSLTLTSTLGSKTSYCQEIVLSR